MEACVKRKHIVILHFYDILEKAKFRIGKEISGGRDSEGLNRGRPVNILGW